MNPLSRNRHTSVSLCFSPLLLPKAVSWQKSRMNKLTPVALKLHNSQASFYLSCSNVPLLMGRKSTKCTCPSFLKKSNFKNSSLFPLWTPAAPSTCLSPPLGASSHNSNKSPSSVSPKLWAGHFLILPCLPSNLPQSPYSLSWTYWVSYLSSSPRAAKPTIPLSL